MFEADQAMGICKVTVFNNKWHGEFKNNQIYGKITFYLVEGVYDDLKVINSIRNKDV